MFKIESYLTPIILNQVAKYVKDIRPQDAQLSLWEGEVSFQNLDMRLDVLEKELQLPFTLLSGHIHELNIHVPWTKLTSEPVKITINTIEFVMKMKTHTCANSSPYRREKPHRGSEDQITGGLVNKIINNIVINCHNIILKYVEEDIVISMNVQLLSFGAADERWHPTMVDVHPIQVLMRKLVKISDLTICLDKTNEAGQIECCQEPVLYRCSMECRILLKYNVNTRATTSTMRIGLFTQSLDVNISSLQFPLILRLCQLLLKMKSERLKNQTEQEQRDDFDNETDIGNESRESYLSWAWNLLPNLTFDTYAAEQSPEDSIPGHTKDIGIYVERLNFTLKNSIFINDTGMGGSKRFRYKPVVRISLGGIYYEMVYSAERQWSNIKTGLTSIVVEPLGKYRSDDNAPSAVIDCSCFEIGSSFIDKSLFDDQCLIADKGWGVTNYEDYSTRITEEYLLFRSPIFAFDLVEYRLTNERSNDDPLSETNAENHVQYRLLSSGLTFRYNQAVLQVIQIINDYVESYEYPSYNVEISDNSRSVSNTKMHPPLLEDFDALMLNIPKSSFKILLTNFNFEFYAITNELMPPGSVQKTTTAQSKRLPHNLKKVLPHLLLHFDTAEGYMRTPLEPERLVHLTCQLPLKPKELVDACYDNYTMSIKNFYIALRHMPSNKLSRLGSIPKTNITVNKLLMPALWKGNEEVAALKMDCSIEQFDIEFAKQDIIAMSRLLHSIMHFDLSVLWSLGKMEETLQLKNETPIKLKTTLYHLTTKMHSYRDCIGANAQLRSISSELICPTQNSVEKHEFLRACYKQKDNRGIWLEVQAKLPKDVRKRISGLHREFALWLDKFKIFINPNFIKFLEYRDEEVPNFEKEHLTEPDIIPPTLPASASSNSATFYAPIPTYSLQHQLGRRSSRNSTFSERQIRKISHPEETIHFSSDREEVSTQENFKSNTVEQKEEKIKPYVDYLKIVKKFALYIEIAQSDISFSDGKSRNEDNEITEYTRIRLPSVHMKSLNAYIIERSNIQRKFTLRRFSQRGTYNWTVYLKNFIIQNCSPAGVEDLVEPIQTVITIALTHKAEHVWKLKIKNDESKTNTNEGTNNMRLSDNQERPSDDVGAISDIGHIELDYRTRSIGSIHSESIIFQTGRDFVTLNVHAETTPIHFFFSTHKLKALESNLKIMFKVGSAFGSSPRQQASQSGNHGIEILTVTEENSSIKEFLDLETNSDASAASDHAKRRKISASLLCQWAIAKIVLEIQSCAIAEPYPKKCLIEFEDMLSTIDMSDDYRKHTCKVGQFSLRYLEKNFDTNDWTMNESLQIKMRATDSNTSPFINVILTNVSVRNFYRKIGIKRISDENRIISELCVFLEGLEIILDMQAFADFIKPLCFLFQSDEINARRSTNVKGTHVEKPIWTGDELPMIHLNSKGLILYLPVKSGNDCCSVNILKIDQIDITPNLDNPLQRKSLRTDLYNKASQLGILSTPGSAIEDRQYELILQNISFSSGDWQAILEQMHELTNTRLSNPAFEWNNQYRRQSPQLAEIFNNFNFHAIFAPCIVYNKILVSGQAVEFNCASDFVVSLTTHQINLINCLIIHINNITEILSGYCDNGRNTIERLSTDSVDIENKVGLEKQASGSGHSLVPASQSTNFIKPEHPCGRERKRNMFFEVVSTIDRFYSIDESSEQNAAQISESGFYSCQSNSATNVRINSKERILSFFENVTVLQTERVDEQKPTSMPETQRHIPQTISLVTGQFIIQIFNVSTEQSFMPLCSLTISQPCFMVTQNVYESTTQFTLFDFTLRMANCDTYMNPSAHKNLAKFLEDNDNSGIDLFPHTVIYTKQGKQSSSGIPPPLFSYKSQMSKKQLLEINIELSKPIVCFLSEKYIEQLCDQYVLVNEVLFENPCFEIRSRKPVVRGSKIKLMRHQLFDADRLYCKFDSIVLKYSNPNEYSCKLEIADLKSNIKFLLRPEKAIGKVSIGTVYLLVDQKIVLHPVEIRLSTEFVTEPWHSLPLVTANIKFNVIQMNACAKELIKLRRAVASLRRILDETNEKWEEYLKNRPSYEADENVNMKNLVPYKYSEGNNTNQQSKKPKQRDEFYQDDLRAGAFQFVELMTDSFLPLPYQIQIIKKNFGIICWRYPQPRKMCRIQIFPVPMAVPNPIHIKCRMEYFSEAHENFLHCCDFWLSETVSKEIELPNRAICANIWRVVIMQSLVSINGDYFDGNEEEDELRSITTIKIDEALNNERKEAEFILHPKVLVACMRIDTSFQSEAVPKFQLLVSLNMLKLNFLNEPAKDIELQKLLKDYKLALSTNINQTFMTLTLENFNAYWAYLAATNNIFSCDMTCSIKCMDYGFLNMVYLLEETTMQSYLHANYQKNLIYANMLLDKICLNINASSIHTLLSSKMYWEECFELEANKQRRRHAFLSKYVVVNQTYSHIAFGQSETTERILLRPKEFHLYSFRSNCFSPEITFFVADDETRITEASQPVPVTLKFEGTKQLQHIRIGNKCLLLKMQKLSTTQMLVLIKGQIELISFVLHDFRIEIRNEGGGSNDVKNTLEYTIEQKTRCSFFRNIQQNSNASMRLKLISSKGKGRSGDIPLRTNKCLPWLVKVPYQNNNFISFWVRILREDIPDISTEQFRPQRVLIIIWPIFEIRSLLNCVLKASETSNHHQRFEVEPDGGRYLLNVPATHLTEHLINLGVDLPLEKHVEKQYKLSLKFMDWNNFFWYDEQSMNIESALDALSEDEISKPTCIGEEEERIKRISQSKSAISIKYSCAPSRDFSCSMCLSIAPWGMFVNATGLEVSVCNMETKARINIASNAMEMLFAINTAFTIDIKSGLNWISSLPIYFKETSASATNKYYVAFEDIASEVVILHDNQVLKFVLDFKVESERKLFTLRSKYNVTNFTKLSLFVLPFTLDHKESSTRGDIKALDAQVKVKKITPVTSSRNCIGVTLDSFHDLNAAKSLRSSDTAFVCFVCIKSSTTSDFSIPIPLTMQFTRKCFSLQNGSESIPLVVTLIEASGIFYLNIFDDVSPGILINNQTEMKLMVARTSASENSKVTSTASEFDGKHFEWYQRVAPYSKCYYTPPEMYSNFPDVETTTCNLTLALWNGNCIKKNMHWSKPIRTDKAWEKFLHIPNHGDVKVIICDKHNVIRVSIFYILQQQEFSVKDLRSRIVTSPSGTQIPESDLETSASYSSITTLLNPAPEAEVAATYKCLHFQNDLENINKPKVMLNCYIKEMQVNLKTDYKESEKKDIFAMCIDECMFNYDDDFDRRQLNVLFANMQIDNQLYSTGNYDFPVVFCAQEMYRCQPILPQLDFLDRVYDDLLRKQPMIKLHITLFDDEMKISDIDCSISPVRAYIEDAYVNDLLDALVECVPSNCVYQAEEEQERITLNAGEILLPRKITEQSICMAEPLKLKSFRIQPLDLLLSVHTSVRLYIALDHSPLSFSSYERQQILTVPLRFGQSVGMHYLSGAIFGAGWVVGSLEILGSPSGLARSFSTGLRDFVSMPVRGLFRGPWGFIVGITQGSASLLCNVTAGTVNSMTKLAASVARNLDRLSLDQDHIDRTDALRRSRPQGFTEGFSQGVTGLGISILGAVGGIARHTLEARTPAQIFTGVGKGIVGVVTKPISGAAELLALTGQGVLQSVGFNAMPQQRSHAPSCNVAVEPSDYRIWKLLPNILETDQILFSQEVTLVERDQLKRAYVFLTSTVFAVIEAKWEKLSFVLPIEKVEISSDSQDKSMICVRIAKEREVNEEDQNYTNQRIMTFLRTSFHSISGNSSAANDPLSDLTQIPTQTDRNRTNLDWSFYINEHLGEYLIGYLKIMHKNIR